MKSDIIQIDSKGNGFSAAIEQTRKTAVFSGLDSKETLRLQLITEEMLSLTRSITGEMQASFWLEAEKKRIVLHLTTQTVLDKEARSELLASATSGKNEAAKSFLGRLRDAFERAMATDPDHSDDVPDDVWSDIGNQVVTSDEWDGMERSVLRKAADEIRIGIRGKLVEMTVSKDFAQA